MSGTNLYRVVNYLDPDDISLGLALGDLVTVDEDEEPYVFTFGERMTLPETPRCEFYYVGTLDDGSILFSRDPASSFMSVYSHSLGEMNDFRPYVEPLVLTQSELDEAFGCPVQVV